MELDLPLVVTLEHSLVELPLAVFMAGFGFYLHLLDLTMVLNQESFFTNEKNLFLHNFNFFYINDL